MEVRPIDGGEGSQLFPNNLFVLEEKTNNAPSDVEKLQNMLLEAQSLIQEIGINEYKININKLKNYE